MIEKEIYVPIWNSKIIIVIGEKQEVSDFFKSKHKGLDVDKYVADGNHFTVIDHELNKKFDYLVLYDENDIETIRHESGHVAWEILNDRLVSVDYDNQEPLFYLQDYISQEVTKLINKNNGL